MTLSRIQQNISANHPLPANQEDGKTRAAVALILHEDNTGLQLLFLVRAEQDGDPWSGHIAFPGGKLEPVDIGPREAAERETKEETDLDLSQADYFGRLDDVVGATLPVVVSGFVYNVEKILLPRLNHEIRESHWVSVEMLLDPDRHLQHRFQFQGTDSIFPAIDILGPGKPILWGLTYRLVGQLLQLGGHGLPGMSPTT